MYAVTKIIYVALFIYFTHNINCAQHEYTHVTTSDNIETQEHIQTITNTNLLAVINRLEAQRTSGRRFSDQTLQNIEFFLNQQRRRIDILEKERIFQTQVIRHNIPTLKELLDCITVAQDEFLDDDAPELESGFEQNFEEAKYTNTIRAFREFISELEQITPSEYAELQQYLHESDQLCRQRLQLFKDRAPIIEERKEQLDRITTLLRRFKQQNNLARSCLPQRNSDENNAFFYALFPFCWIYNCVSFPCL